jgi:hypothetical protein
MVTATGRANMSKTRQISITLREDLIETIKTAVERREARSMSAHVAGKLAHGVITDAFFVEQAAHHRGVT